MLIGGMTYHRCHMKSGRLVLDSDRGRNIKAAMRAFNSSRSHYRHTRNIIMVTFVWLHLYQVASLDCCVAALMVLESVLSIIITKICHFFITMIRHRAPCRIPRQLERVLATAQAIPLGRRVTRGRGPLKSVLKCKLVFSAMSTRPVTISSQV